MLSVLAHSSFFSPLSCHCHFNQTCDRACLLWYPINFPRGWSFNIQQLLLCSTNCGSSHWGCSPWPISSELKTICAKGSWDQFATWQITLFWKSLPVLSLALAGVTCKTCCTLIHMVKKMYVNVKFYWVKYRYVATHFNGLIFLNAYV